MPYSAEMASEVLENFSLDCFQYHLNHTRQAIEVALATHHYTDADRVRCRLLRYVDIQLRRAMYWADAEVDLLALISRNMVEVLFWAKYVSAGPEHIKRFLYDAQLDFRELFVKLSKAAPELGYQIDPSITGRRIALERTDEAEDLLYKLCSKHIHPSSWLVNNLDSVLCDRESRKIFAAHILYHAWVTIETLHDIHFEPLPDSIEMP